MIDCNWKVYVDNYLAGYHILIAHPGLMREIDYAQVIYLWIFPNLTLNIYPDNVSTNLIAPYFTRKDAEVFECFSMMRNRAGKRRAPLFYASRRIP